jgi:hypothetical protein
LKLAVIGEPCVDYIQRGSTKTDKQYGGILYSVISLAVIAGKGSEIFPVMNLGYDEYENITGLLSYYGNIKLDFISKSNHKTRVVKLFYAEEASNPAAAYDREENSTEPVPPVEFEQIKKGLDKFDGILVNMVSGVDLSLDTFKKIREGSNCYIHMDLHNLVMQTFADGTRKRFPLKDWSDWCGLCDTIQMNETEISILTGDNVTEYETAEKILKSGTVKAVIVTRGVQGASLYKMHQKKLIRINAAAIPASNFVDSTGSGDVFAASFFYKNAETKLKDLEEPLQFANQMAGLNTALNGIDELYKLNG